MKVDETFYSYATFPKVTLGYHVENPRTWFVDGLTVSCDNIQMVLQFDQWS